MGHAEEKALANFYRYERGFQRTMRWGNVMVIRSCGHMDLKMAQDLCRAMGEAFNNASPLCFYADWFDLESYDSDARKVMAKYSFSTRSQITSMIVGARSKVVKMAVVVSAIVLPGFEIMDTRTDLLMHLATHHECDDRELLHAILTQRWTS